MESSPKKASSLFDEPLEKRGLTVLFCDIVGSSRICSSLSKNDDEDWQEFLRIYWKRCEEIINEFQGVLPEKPEGDGILATFGLPNSFANTTQYAMKAAIKLLANMDQVSEEIRSVIGENILLDPIQLRISVNFGTVTTYLWTQNHAPQESAMGHALSFAKNMQEVAPPNSIVISHNAYRILKDQYKCERIDTSNSEKIPNQRIYRVLSELTNQVVLTPFIGRDDELKLLNKKWLEVTAGSGRFILIKGDAGIGKSRLIREFNEQLGTDVAKTFICRCSPFHNESSLYPILKMLQGVMEFGNDDDEGLKLSKIQSNLERYRLSPASYVPILASLLSVDYDTGDYNQTHASAPSQKQRLHEVLLEWLLRVAEDKPIRLIVEDFHWMDPSTTDFLTYIASSIADLPIMLLVTYRPGVKPPWRLNNTHVIQMEVNPLSSVLSVDMIELLSGDRQLSAEIVHKLIDKTGNNPLFIEESVLDVLNRASDEKTIDEDSYIPIKLQDLLLTRLDTTGDAKKLAQYASVIGREFSANLLFDISGQNIKDFSARLGELKEVGLVSAIDENRQDDLYFKHELIRAKAYDSMVRSQRIPVHKKLAETLCSGKYAEFERTQPEIIAYHFNQAQVSERAIEYYELASTRAIRIHANVEAISHLTDALELLEAENAVTIKTVSQLEIREIAKQKQIDLEVKEQNKRKRFEQELEEIGHELELARKHLTYSKRSELKITRRLASRFMATKGYGAREVGQFYSRALKLSQELEDSNYIIKNTYGLEAYHFMRADFDRATELSKDCHALAIKNNDVAGLLKVDYTLGEIHFHLGQQHIAREHLEACRANYENNKSHLQLVELQDPGVMSHCYLSWSYWLTGAPDKAIDYAEAAVNLADNEIKTPFNSAIAHLFLAGIRLFRGEFGQAKQDADTAYELCLKHDLGTWLAYAMAVRGRAAVSLGQSKEEIENGIAEIKRSFNMWIRSRAMVTRPYYRAILSECLDITGEYELAMECARKGVCVAERIGEGYYLAEIHRVYGASLLRLPHPSGEQIEAAKQHIEKAINISKEQSTKSIELRALLDLIEWQELYGSSDDSRQALKQVKHLLDVGIVGGRNTADIRKAERIVTNSAITE
ncbi:MAG: AAA family ATPase [Proteobacteria bacterium]|nr:AAA family ATPase [Pseudomonadota bacterium]